MNTSQVKTLQRSLEGETRLIETHISWVILSAKFAYKIKKPVKFSFLDFSTVQLRKHYCLREIELNSRLAPEMYKSVVPVAAKAGGFNLGGPGKIVDWAVKMMRMDEGRQMDLLLQRGEVGREQMKLLAEGLAAFHSKVEVVTDAPDLDSLQADFADIDSCASFLEAQTDLDAGSLSSSIDRSSRLLAQLEERIHFRFESGFYVDGHGDLHSGNIFLLEKPVVFDCIDFNDHFRREDVLNELAFLCMDLDFYKKDALAKYFMERYQEIFPCFFNKEDSSLFMYYKWYRSNVKAKINAIKCQQAEQPEEKRYRLSNVRSYLKLFRQYESLLARGQTGK